MFDLAISPVDLAIVLVYVVFAVLLGLWVGGRQRHVNDYFLGDRSLPWWALLLSIVATETSTVTFLSIPGVSYAAENGDFRFLQVAVGYVVGRTLVSWLLLPSYFRGSLFTSYEVLLRHFGETARRLASLLFMITRTVADALKKNGIRRERIRTVSAGSHEPLVAQAYDEERRALNRRVEIIVTEAVVDDYSGQPLPGEERDPGHGG